MKFIECRYCHRLYEAPVEEGPSFCSKQCGDYWFEERDYDIGRQGYTLTELLLVVTIIGILALIIAPKAGHGLRRAFEARTKGNLGVLRGAIGSYTAAHDGQIPVDRLQCLIKEGYLDDIPMAFYPWHHPPGNQVDTGGFNAMADSKEDWFYCQFAPLPTACGKWEGWVFANCFHTDLNGKPWWTQ